MEENKIELEITAYHRWLLMISGGDEFKLAIEIANQAVHDQNPQAQHLIELVGETIEIPESFHKAARLLLTAVYEQKEILEDYHDYSKG